MHLPHAHVLRGRVSNHEGRAGASSFETPRTAAKCIWAAPTMARPSG